MKTIDSSIKEEDVSGKKKGNASAWPVRVDLTTRNIIRQAAAREGMSLEEFFGTRLSTYCKKLLDENYKEPVLESETLNLHEFVSKADFNMFKQELLTIIEQAQPKSLVNRLRRFLQN